MSSGCADLHGTQETKEREYWLISIVVLCDSLFETVSRR